MTNKLIVTALLGIGFVISGIVIYEYTEYMRINDANNMSKAYAEQKRLNDECLAYQNRNFGDLAPDHCVIGTDHNR